MDDEDDNVNVILRDEGSKANDRRKPELVETYVQLLSRLIQRPPVVDLDSILFFNELDNKDVIEVKGSVSSGVPSLLVQIVTKSILPSKYNGLDMDVFYINTENQFQISAVFEAALNEMREFEGHSKLDEEVKSALTKLKMIHCYNYYQFLVTINNLQDILIENKKIGLIIIDSISAYYWQQRETELSYDSFVLKLLKNVQKSSSEFKILTLYTKPIDFVSKNKSSNAYELRNLLSYDISLVRDEKSNELNCSVRYKNKIKTLKYEITKTKLKWLINNS
ncbi:hypothetical protein TKK_0017315 [Trichogramma kaykai]|uniref:Rad51-like C-terminal domain-containing protein n=1 Tax=Trichogramma kaykai TaxID=54128 RepID=A0ABD2W2M5_9HYME